MKIKTEAEYQMSFSLDKNGLSLINMSNSEVFDRKLSQLYSM